MGNKAIVIFLLFCSVLQVSCLDKKDRGRDTMLDLFPQPKIVPLNTQNGYVINQFTNDTILQLINSSCDTVITGRPMPVKGREIDAMEEQKILIDQKFEEWRGNEAQVDDVCMIGVSVSSSRYIHTKRVTVFEYFLIPSNLYI